METFYIRFRGNTRGPYNRDELLQLAERGRFAKHHEVSADGSTWERAGQRPDLFSEQGSVEPASSSFDGDAWYYSLSEGEEEGPVSLREVKSMIRSEMLDGDALLWTEGMSDWEPADEVSELQQLFKQRSRSSSSSQRAQQQPDSQSGGIDPLLGMVKYCTGCGKQIHPEAVNCPACGVRCRKTGTGGSDKSRTTAAILALFLGGLGAHHFYLNQPIRGIVYLVFCFTFIPAIVAFVEAIILLCMSDERFEQQYVN